MVHSKANNQQPVTSNQYPETGIKWWTVCYRVMIILFYGNSVAGPCDFNGEMLKAKKL
jgi:hypothetical protein